MVVSVSRSHCIALTQLPEMVECIIDTSDNCREVVELSFANYHDLVCLEGFHAGSMAFHEHHSNSIIDGIFHGSVQVGERCVVSVGEWVSVFETWKPEIEVAVFRPDILISGLVDDAGGGSSELCFLVEDARQWRGNTTTWGGGGVTWLPALRTRLVSKRKVILHHKQGRKGREKE